MLELYLIHPSLPLLKLNKIWKNIVFFESFAKMTTNPVNQSLDTIKEGVIPMLFNKAKEALPITAICKRRNSCGVLNEYG